MENFMTKKELATGIIHYMFPPTTSKFGFNIVAVVDGSKAILIDVAYEAQAQQVLDDLSAKGITIGKIIISHFHADHLFGINALPDVPIYGGSRYEETLVFEKSTEEEIKKYTPTVAVDKPTILEFGRHKLEMIPLAGHSVCTMLVKINGQFLYVADELVFHNDGRQTLPYLCDGKRDIKRQLESLHRLKEYTDLTIIPGHGPAFDGSLLRKYIRNLEIYLNAVLEADGKITYEDAVRNCDYPLLQSNWHEMNCK